MRVGSVEYAVIAFPGNQFNGEVVPALKELVDNGVVNIIDLAFVMKGEDGSTTAVEVTELPRDIAGAFEALDHDVQGLLNEEDIQFVAEGLDPNSSAGLIVWENVWAARFAEAVRDSGGILVANEKIPAAAVEAALEFLASEEA